MTLSVTNAGATIPPHDLERLFQPFARGGDAIEGGLGLGLYIASEIVRAHGGTLAVTSEAHVTCFTAAIPCAVPNIAAP